MVTTPADRHRYRKGIAAPDGGAATSAHAVPALSLTRTRDQIAQTGWAASIARIKSNSTTHHSIGAKYARYSNDASICRSSVRYGFYYFYRRCRVTWYFGCYCVLSTRVCYCLSRVKNKYLR